MYIFDHIFKTAGTTFNLAYLPAAFEPGEFLVVRGMLADNREDIDTLKMRPAEESRQLKMIAGHNTGQLRDVFPGARFLTLVREPTDRAISGYLHALLHDDALEIVGSEMRAHGTGLADFVEKDLFARRYADFVSFHDWQARTLLGDGSQTAERWTRKRIRRAIRSRFHLVGYTEAFEKFLFLLHITEGFPLALFKNRLVRPERRSFEVTKADRAMIERHSCLDRAVYDCVRAEFDRRAAEILTPEMERQYRRYLSALHEFQNDPAVGLSSRRFSSAGWGKPKHLMWLAATQAPFDLEERAACNAAEVSGGGPIIVVTPAQQWSFAVMFPIREGPRRRLPQAPGFTICIEAEIEKGKIGAGIVERDLQRYLSREIEAGVGKTIFELEIPALGEGCALIIRNTAPGGAASKICIHSLKTFAWCS